MRSARWFLALLLAALLAGPAAADELEGKFQATGTTPQGKPYGGAVQIEQVGGLHIVLWKLTNGPAYKGIALRDGDVLGAAYGAPDTKFGLVVYEINGGTLTGAWTDSVDLKSELGRETLKGSPNLAGVYNISLGQNRDGITNYGGQVEIRRSGDSYLVIWAKPAAVGIGVRLKDQLVVAYTSNFDPKKLPGVVAYQETSADALSGIWAVWRAEANGTKLNIAVEPKVGHEDLKRVP